MRGKITAVLGLLVFLFWSCLSVSNGVPSGTTGDEAEKTNDEKGEAETETVTLTVLHYAGNAGAAAAADTVKLWKEFQERNPDIHIVREDLVSEPFYQKTELYAASGNLPDVLFVWPAGRSTTLHERKLLKDLSPLVRKDKLQNSYLPLCLDPALQGGGYTAMIPLSISSSHAFYVNMEVLRDCGLRPAETYTELKAQVPILKAKGYETVLMPNGDTWVMSSCLFSVIAGRFGGTGWEKNILSGRAKFTDPEFVNALAFIGRLYTDGVLAPSSLTLDYGDGPDRFAANKGAYYIDGDWRAAAFVTDQSTGRALIPVSRQHNFKITVFPGIDGAKINKSASAEPGMGWAMSAAIPAGSAKEKAAWKLIKWLTGREAQTVQAASLTIAAPSRTDIDYGTLHLEPLQAALCDFGKEYTAATVNIETIFHYDVCSPLDDGLREIGLGTKTAPQLAAEIQTIFDAGRSEGRW